MTTSGRRLDYQIRYGHSLGEYGKAPFIKVLGVERECTIHDGTEKNSRESWQTVGVRVRLFLGQVRLGFFLFFFTTNERGWVGGYVG